MEIDHDNLEDFADPEGYDFQDSSDTGVAFYTRLARETGGPVLEIACGTGRVTIPIAREGFSVTGVDIVPGMVEVARRKSAGLDARWAVGDGRSFHLGQRFRLIFLTGNAFQMFLTREDQEALLARVQEHLEDDGLFAFETRNPRWRSHVRPDEIPADGFVLLDSEPQHRPGPTYVDRHGRTVHSWTTEMYDPVAQILHWTTDRRWDEEGAERNQRIRIALRFTFPQELEALLHYNGFKLERRYGDWNLEPLGPNSRSIIVVCRRR